MLKKSGLEQSIQTTMCIFNSVKINIALPRHSLLIIHYHLQDAPDMTHQTSAVPIYEQALVEKISRNYTNANTFYKQMHLTFS